jgi:hypothetical protein
VKFSLLLTLTILSCAAIANAAEVNFSQSARRVDCYEFLEVTLKVASPPAGNPFLDAEVTGDLTASGSTPLKLDGFCDSADGGVFRIRFMPTTPGEHRYSVTYKRGGVEEKFAGTFTARRSSAKGLVRVDREHPTAPPPTGCWAGATTR